MTKVALPASGGAATQSGAAKAAIAELQGLTVSVLAGGAANSAIALSAIRTEDTILSALNNNAGAITDVTGTISISDLHASGTITAAAVAAADTVTVNGRTYTAVANGTTPAKNQFSVGASNTECAANLAKAINACEGDNTKSGVVATAAAAVVTVTAVAEGTAGNAIALVSSSGVRLALSGATLSGGAASGSIKSSGVTNTIILFWYNKNQ